MRKRLNRLIAVSHINKKILLCSVIIGVLFCAGCNNKDANNETTMESSVTTGTTGSSSESENTNEATTSTQTDESSGNVDYQMLSDGDYTLRIEAGDVSDDGSSVTGQIIKFFTCDQAYIDSLEVGDVIDLSQYDDGPLNIESFDEVSDDHIVINDDGAYYFALNSQDGLWYLITFDDYKLRTVDGYFQAEVSPDVVIYDYASEVMFNDVDGVSDTPVIDSSIQDFFSHGIDSYDFEVTVSGGVITVITINYMP